MTFAYIEDFQTLKTSQGRELNDNEKSGMDKLSAYLEQIESNQKFVTVDTLKVINSLESGWPNAKINVYDQYRTALEDHYAEYEYTPFQPQIVKNERRSIAIKNLQEEYNSYLNSLIQSSVDKIIEKEKSEAITQYRRKISDDSKFKLEKIISGKYWWLFPLFSISVILNILLLFNRQRKNKYRSDSYKGNHSRNRSGDPDLILNKNALNERIKNLNNEIKDLKDSRDKLKEKYEELEKSHEQLKKSYQDKIHPPDRVSQSDNSVPRGNRIIDNTLKNNPVRQRQFETGANRPSDASCVTYYFEFPVKGGILGGFSKEKKKKSLYKTIYNERENTGSLELILPATSSVLDSPEFFFQHACRYSNAPFPSMNEIRQRENGLGKVEKKDDKWVVTKPIEVEFL